MTVDIVIGLITGAVLGLFFFGGLFWTVRRLPVSRRPTLLAFSSFLVRGLVVAGGVVLVSDGSLVRILTALVGVMAVRTVLVRMAGDPRPDDSRRPVDEGAGSWI